VNKKPKKVEVSNALEVIGVKVEDFLGLGKAADSPAAKEIVRAFTKALQAGLSTVTGPIGTYLASKADASSEITKARARYQVAQIDAKTAGLLERAKPRLIAQETRRQFNIEETVAKAISFAGESNDDSAQEIPNEWFLRWSEGA
jgi:hypothetical protein